MSRPTLALWVKWHIRWPAWLWTWANNRVDAWHEANNSEEHA